MLRRPEYPGSFSGVNSRLRLNDIMLLGANLRLWELSDALRGEPWEELGATRSAHDVKVGKAFLLPGAPTVSQARGRK